MIPARLVLLRAGNRLIERLEKLEPGLDDADPERWREYAALAEALAAIVPHMIPGAGGELLTTEQLADRLQVSPRTIRRRVKSGELQPVRLGRRGRSALRWEIQR